MMTIAFEFARRFAPWIVIAVFALMAVLAGPSMCRKMNADAARARLGEEGAKAASRNGEDAVATVGAAARREAQSSEVTRTNEQEIRNAQGADTTVDPAVRDAGLGGLCRRTAYGDD